ncbi:MAG: PadR family transcriptional regulator [Anaerolineales bacterium]|jgi:DNA-binding PadR family transcriptional regulator
MSLKHELLGFLDLRPQSGYDLAGMCDASINFLWPATHSQIYRTLKELLKDGMVRMKQVEQSERPSKKVYSVTKAGKVELRRWIAAPLDLPAPRHGLLLQLAFADVLEIETILDLLQAHKEKLRTRLEICQRDRQALQLEQARSEPSKFLWGLILWNAILNYECELEWTEEAIQSLSQQTWEPAKR